jgi:arylsulfatase A-like enzyme
MLNGTPNEFMTFNGVSVPVKDQFLWYEFWGSERTFPHFAAGWSWAMDTPFKWTKQVASHFGGTAQGLCMSWPGHIKDEGGIRRQFHHIIDIVPTILEATGIAAPDTINGIKQRAIEGVSMVYTWDKANAKAPTRHTTQYFEMLGNRAIYHDGWVAATTPVTLPWELNTAQPPDVITGYKWELYNINEDVTEFNDLAAKNMMEHTTPIIFPEDEDFDVGQDTRTGVAMLEYRYDTPFKFTGKINRLTFDLGPVQYTQADRQQLPAIAHRVALTKD